MSERLPSSAGVFVKVVPGRETTIVVSARHLLGAGLVVEPLDLPTNWFHIHRPGESHAVETGFAQAHAMLSMPGVLRAEPYIKGGLGNDTEETSPPIAARGTDPTRDKWTWPVEQIEAKAARDEFHVRGNNVRIASLDTGVTQHPELVVGTRVRFDLGYNFVEGITDSTEPLEWVKGHGAATAAFVVGLEGKQISDGDAFVGGVAPDAELVPVRADDDVWFYFAKNDIKAIRHAVNQGCHVITMSRGGRESDSLHDVVRDAKSKGVIIVAAASNCNLGCGVFAPAIYPEVICVAGSTYDRTPWSSSSYGSSVTIAAPAENVYRARTTDRKNAYHYDVERSSGTSYATPLVAGAAALRLEFHGGPEAVRKKVGVENVATLFKYLLRTHGWTAGKDWDTSRYGPGILNCPKLLAASFPDMKDLREFQRKEALRIVSVDAELKSIIQSRGGRALDPRTAHLFTLELAFLTKFHSSQHSARGVRSSSKSKNERFLLFKDETAKSWRKSPQLAAFIGIES